MTLIVVGNQVSTEEEDCRVKVWGEYSGGDGNCAIATGGYRMWLVGMGINHHNEEELLGHTLCKGCTGEFVSNWWGNIFEGWGDVDGEEGGKTLPLLLLAGLGGVVGGVVGTGGHWLLPLQEEGCPGPGSRTDNAHALPHGPGWTSCLLLSLV